MKIQLVPTAGSSGLLALPWAVPLADWEDEHLVELERGIHRHVVRSVQFGDALFTLKELPERLARKEYVLLRGLAREQVPVVEAIGVVADRGRDLDGVLITRNLEYSLPYRVVLGSEPRPEYWDRLLDAIAGLLVRLHLATFFWGDCSLSNTLFRRDAGALTAYLVDAETGEMHDGLRAALTDGQREHDLEIARENIAGELFDLEAELGREFTRDPLDTADDVVARYERLWLELTTAEEFAPTETHRLEQRLRRLNELGFDVEEVEVLSDGGSLRLHFDPKVVEPGHHRRRLLHLTGLDAQENQARRLLNDIAAFGARERDAARPAPSEAALAGRWLAEVFEPAIAAVPRELRGKRQAAELFHELLEHRWFLSEQARRDVGLDEAIRRYVADVLRAMPDER